LHLEPSLSRRHVVRLFARDIGGDADQLRGKQPSGKQPSGVSRGELCAVVPCN
jgi:hypothetical protein